MQWRWVLLCCDCFYFKTKRHCTLYHTHPKTAIRNESQCGYNTKSFTPKFSRALTLKQHP